MLALRSVFLDITNKFRRFLICAHPPVFGAAHERQVLERVLHVHDSLSNHGELTNIVYL
jgi:hypothetical protein